MNSSNNLDDDELHPSSTPTLVAFPVLPFPHCSTIRTRTLNTTTSMFRPRTTTTTIEGDRTATTRDNTHNPRTHQPNPTATFHRHHQYADDQHQERNGERSTTLAPRLDWYGNTNEDERIPNTSLHQPSLFSSRSNDDDHDASHHDNHAIDQERTPPQYDDRARDRDSAYPAGDDRQSQQQHRSQHNTATFLLGTTRSPTSTTVYDLVDPVSEAAVVPSSSSSSSSLHFPSHRVPLSTTTTKRKKTSLPRQSTAPSSLSISWNSSLSSSSSSSSSYDNEGDTTKRSRNILRGSSENNLHVDQDPDPDQRYAISRCFAWSQDSEDERRITKRARYSSSTCTTITTMFDSDDDDSNPHHRSNNTPSWR